MPDTNDTAKPDAQVEHSGPPPVRSVWGISYMKRKFHEYKAKRKDETPQDKAARRTASATVAIAAFTVVLAVVSIETLREIKGGGKDTHDLAASAGKQAEAAIAQSQGMEILGLATRAQAIAAIDQVSKLQAGVDESHRLALAAKQSADTAERSLEISERPWVGVVAITLKDNIESGKSPVATMTVQNSGHNPAIHVETEFRMDTICGPFPRRPAYIGATGKPSRSLLLPGFPLESGETKFRNPIGETYVADLVKRDECDLYAFGRITYDETINPSIHHWRHVCGFWQKQTPKTILGCNFYNDGDEDYPDGKEPN